MNLINRQRILTLIPVALAAGLILFPANGYTTQLHADSEGIITHQIGHLFFLFSMVVLIFTITGKGLNKEKGWRLIQYSAFFFILWNLDAVAAHFFDNQIQAVKIENISLTTMRIVTGSNSSILAGVYYMLKLDHLLCVPAMFFLYRGLSGLVNEQRRLMGKKDRP
jgi:hypothetical protein